MNKPRILSTGLAALIALPVFAVDRNWTGGGAPGDWNDPLNWSGGVPTDGTADRIFLHLPGSLTGPALSADVIQVGVGTPGVPTSGFTFGAGTYSVNFIGVGEAHDGLNPTSNRFGRAFINSGTTVNVGNFWIGDWDGGTGHVVQSGGAVNISNQFRVGHWPQDATTGTESTYTMNGGTLTIAGDPADAFNESQAGNVFLGIDSTGVLIVNNGTFTAKGITLDNRGATTGEDRLEINGGIVNLGANGIVSPNAANPGTYEVKLGGGTLRATASWTSPLETTLTAGGTGIIYDTNGNDISLTGALTGAGGLRKIGAGRLLLAGTNTFSGGIIVDDGTLQVGNSGPSGSLGTGATVVNALATLNFLRTDTLRLSGSLSGTGALLVGSGKLEVPNVAGSLVTSVAPGATLSAAGTLGPIALSAGASLETGVGGIGNLLTNSLNMVSSALKFTVASAATKLTVTDPGGFVPTGSNSIQVSVTSLTPGNYTLVDYAGTIGGAGFGSFTLSGLPTRAIGGLVHNTANTSIDLNITSINFPKWTGAVDGNWDTTTDNWRLVTGGAATKYIETDNVLFDDTAPGTTTVNVTGPFSPSAVTFNNGTKEYTLTGPGGIAGTTGLLKQGTGRVILATANTYTGTTTIEAGVLQLGDGVTGSLAGTSVTVAAAGTLELNLAAPYSIPTGGAGIVRTIGSNNFDITAGVLSGNVQFNVAGLSTQVINVENQASLTGPVSITGGTLRAVGTQALGTIAGSTTISGGGTLDVNGLDLGGEQIFVSGAGVNGNGAIVNNGGGTTLNLHRVTLTGNATFGGSGRWDIRAGGVAGELLDLAGFKLTKVGSNQVSLVEVNSTAGDIDINGGTFSIEAGSAVQGPGTITLNPGGSLGLWVNQPGKLTRTIVANGGGITELGSGGNTNVDSNVAMLADLTYTVNNAATVLFQTGALVESGTPRVLNVNGPGRLVLTGNNVWTGGTNVNGVLQVGNGGTAGTLGTGPVNVGGTLVLGRSDGFTLSQDINPAAPSGALILVGGGTVNLTSGTDIRVNELHFGVNGRNDTVGGVLNVSDGTSLTVQNAFIVGNSNGGGGTVAGTINQTGGFVDVNAFGPDGRNFVLGHWPQGQGTYNQSGGVLTSPNISMAISWDGSGTYNLSGGSASVLGLRFGHSGAQSGVFNLTGGVLNLGAEGIWEQNAGLPNDINLGGGTISAATNTTINLPVEFTGINGDVTFDSNGNNLTLLGTISGAGGLKKAGEGQLIINNASFAAGTTAVNGGTLLVNSLGGSGTGSGNVTVSASGRLGGNGIIGNGAGAIAVSLTGKLAPGVNAAGTLRFNLGTGMLDISPAVLADASGALEFELGATSDSVVFTSGRLSIGTGVLEFDDFNFTTLGTLAQGTYLLFDGVSPITGSLGLDVSGSLPNGLFGNLQLADGGNDLVLQVVPEPGTTTILIAGFALLAGSRRRRSSP